MSRTTGVVIAAAAIAFGFAHAAATPVSPAPGAVLSSSHPVFRWAVPPNEASRGIYVAKAPATMPDGQFHRENVVASEFFIRDLREWSARVPLYAGSYWWIVRTFDRAAAEVRYSSPSPFRIAVSFRIVSFRLRRNTNTYTPDSLDIDVQWRTNVRELIVSSAVFRAGRRLWRARERESSIIGSTGTSSFDWTKPRRIPQNARLRVVVTLRAGSATKTVARTVRAP
jgi:hypothetical protein